MILIGLDDTDTTESRGTNQLAKLLIRTVLSDYQCVRIVRHQLLIDEQIPYTSKNGSASIWLKDQPRTDLDGIFRRLCEAVQKEFIEGSDPGLCVCADVPHRVIAFGRHCQQAVVARSEAIDLAATSGVRLAGLGGTCGGVIGALAAVGLAATADDGRVVHSCRSMESLSGPQPVRRLAELGVATAKETGELVTRGIVDVGKKLRPNLRKGQHVLFVESAGPGTECDWKALKLP